MGWEIIVIGMVAVFLALLVLSVVIEFMAKLFNPELRVKQQEAVSPPSEEDLGVVIAAALAAYTDKTEEIVPILSSAIATYLGSKAEGVRIVSVRELPRVAPSWGLAGRMDALASRK